MTSRSLSNRRSIGSFGLRNLSFIKMSIANKKLINIKNGTIYARDLGMDYRQDKFESESIFADLIKFYRRIRYFIFLIYDSREFQTRHIEFNHIFGILQETSRGIVFFMQKCSFEQLAYLFRPYPAVGRSSISFDMANRFQSSISSSKSIHQIVLHGIAVNFIFIDPFVS